MYKVKNSRVLCSFKKVFVVLAVCLSMHFSLRANNVRLNGTVKVMDVTSGVATLELDLSWDNSWRDNFNWDAVWIFLKYKPASGAWSHVMLQETGHGVTPGYQLMNGKNSDGSVLGVYVFLDKNDVKQHASTTVTLKWACPNNYTKADFDKNRVFLLAQGIEMVYIPFGAYYLGDGASDKTFGDAEGNPILINGEESVNIYQCSPSGRVVISERNANYPKGYHGFYIMKYETSQEQYVTFLNTLTKAQQETLLGSSFLSALSPGRYIFGDTLRPSCRNGIVLRAKPAGQPYIFDHDLNGNGVCGEDGDGQCIACNYISLNDALSYACWAGLRPMSELEYERTCRLPFPQKPEEREYVWNSNSGLSRMTSIIGSGGEMEVAGNTTCNVNSGNGLSGSNFGPVRCGLFARSASTQLTAGATYWGVMEMGGNVQEIVANVGNTSLVRTLNGLGSYAPGLWGTTPGQFGVRGGSFSGADSLLRTSDRSRSFSYFTSLTIRDSTVGFRLVRSLDNDIVTVNPGVISLSGPLCPGVESRVRGDDASVEGFSGVFPLSYVWSYSTDNGTTWTAIPEAMEKELRYKKFESGKPYLFRRTAVCALGDAQVQTQNAMTASVSTILDSVSSKTGEVCEIELKVWASGDNLKYQWFQNDRDTIQGATSDTYETGKDGRYRCGVSGTCGLIYTEELEINNTLPGDDILEDPRDGKKYKIRKMPDGHWWMIQDLRFGECDNSTFYSYSATTVQNQIAAGYYGVCIASTADGGGYLYNWQAAMNHPDAVYGMDVNPSGNVSDDSPVQWQGICPDGWHLPSGGNTGELQQLYAELGRTVSRIYPGCSDFRGVLNGRSYRDGVMRDHGYGFCWSSTYGHASYAYYMEFYGKEVLQYCYDKYYGLAVRCVRDY